MGLASVTDSRSEELRSYNFSGVCLRFWSWRLLWLGVEGGVEGVGYLGESMLVLDLERSNTSLKMWLLMKSMIWMLLLHRYSVFIRALSNYSWASSTMFVVGLYDLFKQRILLSFARNLSSALDDFNLLPFLFFHSRHRLMRMYSLQS